MMIKRVFGRLVGVFFIFLAGVSTVHAVAIAVPDPGPRLSGFAQPLDDLTHAYLIYGLVEPPSAAGAGVSPFVVSLGSLTGGGVATFDLQSRESGCFSALCAYTVLGLYDEASRGVVVAMGLDIASDVIGRGDDFTSVFNIDELTLGEALLNDDTAALAGFFTDNVGRVSGAGVSPFLPRLGRLSVGANPTPHPDCPPLAVGANPTPHPDCPGPSTLARFSAASFGGTANAEVFAVPEPGALALLMIGLAMGFMQTGRRRCP